MVKINKNGHPSFDKWIRPFDSNIPLGKNELIFRHLVPKKKIEFIDFDCIEKFQYLSDSKKRKYTARIVNGQPDGLICKIQIEI